MPIKYLPLDLPPDFNSGNKADPRYLTCVGGTPMLYRTGPAPTVAIGRPTPVAAPAPTSGTVTPAEEKPAASPAEKLYTADEVNAAVAEGQTATIATLREYFHKLTDELRPEIEKNKQAAFAAGFEEGRQAASGKTADAIEQTAVMLGKADRQIAVVRYLAGRDNRQATLKDIDKDVYKRLSGKPSNIRNVRRQAEKTRDNLADKRCPLRLDISQNTVRLIDAEPVA
jgi:hypothetical protein